MSETKGISTNLKRLVEKTLKGSYSKAWRAVGNKKFQLTLGGLVESEVGKIIAKDAQSYRVLTIICMSGECSENAVKQLIPNDKYREKVLQRLQQDKLINRYEREGVRGYRLAKKGKDLLLGLDRENFSFYLLDGADYSMRRPAMHYRSRQHRISESLSMMEASDIEIKREKKVSPFEVSVTDPDAVKMQSAFFHAREVKVQQELTRKILNSKMTGVWIGGERSWICYNMAQEKIKWYENIENRTNILITSMLREYLPDQRNTNAILLGSSMDEARQCLNDAKQRAFFMNVPFERFCYIPMDSKGTVLLQMLEDRDTYGQLISILSEDLKEKDETAYILHDGFNEAEMPVLISIDFDLKRLVQFITQLSYSGKTGEVICFDFQKEAIREYCGEKTKISEVDFETVRQNFFHG